MSLVNPLSGASFIHNRGRIAGAAQLVVLLGRFGWAVSAELMPLG